MKALIVEDNKDVVDTIELCLQMRWPTVEIISTNSGAKALELSSDDKPDIIILDLGLPDMDGFKVLEKLKSTRSTAGTPVIIVSARHGETNRVKGLENGADDYIEKPFSHGELLARVNAVIRRMNKKQQDAEYVKVGPLVINAEGRQVWLDNKPLNLTATEWLIIDVLFRRYGQIVTHVELGQHVWQSQFVSSSMIRMAMQRLRAKIGDNDKTNPILRSHRGQGYSLGSVTLPEAKVDRKWI